MLRIDLRFCEIIPGDDGGAIGDTYPVIGVLTTGALLLRESDFRQVVDFNRPIMDDGIIVTNQLASGVTIAYQR